MNTLKLNTMKTTNTIKLLAFLFIAAFAFTSCDEDDHDHDDDDDHDHEEEVITTVTYTLTNNADNSEVTMKWFDVDGDGGEEPVLTVSGALAANATYTGAIELLNETESPAEDITEEIKEEDDEHEFFYSSSVAGISIEKTDEDEDGNPVGLATTLTTADAGTGSFTIVLKHEPTKPNDGTVADAGGSTDVEVTFSIEVE